jgi:hypothetical protein
MSGEIRLPKPMLVVDKHEVFRPRFAAIDVHNHLGRSFGGDWVNRPPQELKDVLDESGIDTIVNLDGGFADDFYRELEKWSVLEERVLVFTGVAWHRLATSTDLGERAAAELEQAVKAGARGLKIWKETHRENYFPSTHHGSIHFGQRPESWVFQCSFMSATRSPFSNRSMN